MKSRTASAVVALLTLATPVACGDDGGGSSNTDAAQARGPISIWYSNNEQEVAWGKQADAVYPVELLVLAQDRPGLLRDVSEVYAREKLNVVGVNSSSANGEARMLFTIEIRSAADVNRVLAAVREVKDVFTARRR